MIISSFNLTNWMPLLGSYLIVGYWSVKNNRFVQNIWRELLHSFLQSVADANWTGDENLVSSLVAEMMNF